MNIRLHRRSVLSLLGTSAAAWPLAARAQQAATPLVAFLNSGSLDGYAPMVAAFRQGLRKTGYVGGQNVAVEYSWAGGQYDRVPAMALELIAGRQVAVIVANTPGALAIKAAIRTIPIVFTTASDPVQAGLVASLARPGGNVTGVSTLGGEITPKRLELAHELAPAAAVIPVLVNPTNTNATEPQLRDLQVAARILGIQLQLLHASNDHDLDAIFAALGQQRPSALVIGNDGFYNGRSERIAALSLRYAVPTIHQDRAFVTAGGLMSYGASIPDLYRLAGIYTGRILKGDKPADLPVQQATKIELISTLRRAVGNLLCNQYVSSTLPVLAVTMQSPQRALTDARRSPAARWL
jgi:putative ABC transport system substrate-binding protein